MALLDLKGKALGISVAELLGGYCREEVPVIGYLFIDDPEANADKAAAFVAAGHTELKLKVGRDLGQDHDTLAAIRDRVGSSVKIRIDANMNWSVPAAVKWIRALEQFDLQYVEQPVPDFDLQGMAHVRRSVSVPIAADEGCTDLRSALELIKAEACDVFVVYPSEAGGLTRACQIATLAAAAGKWCAIGSWAELGVATTANAHVVAASSNFPFASDTHYPLQLERRPKQGGRDRARQDRRFARARVSASFLTRRTSHTSLASSFASRRSTTTSKATRRASDRFSRNSPDEGGVATCQTSRPKARLSRVRSAGATCSQEQAGSVQLQSLQVLLPAQQVLRPGA